MAGRARVKPPRLLADGRNRRHDVAFRLGGQSWPEKHGGSFPTKTAAQTRCDLINGILAGARTPEDAWRELQPLLKRGAPTAPRTLGDVLDEMLRGAVHLTEGTVRSKTTIAKRLDDWRGRDPWAITPADVQELVLEHAPAYQPATLKKTIGLLAEALDFAGVDPNPVRHRNVRLPRQTRAEFAVMTRTEFELILAHIAPRQRTEYQRILRWIECFGLRIGEACGLTWDDVDWQHQRFRVRRGVTKTESGARWLPVPDSLMVLLADVPPDDRSGKLFPGMSGGTVDGAMRRACVAAGIAVYSPHDLRHRRASLWSAQGTPDALVARRGGWADMSVPHRTYLHVIAPDDDVWAEFWGEALERAE